jgi:hypothetical protein
VFLWKTTGKKIIYIEMARMSTVELKDKVSESPKTIKKEDEKTKEK